MNRSIFIVVTSIIFFTVLSFAAEKKPTTGPVGFEKFEERIAGTLVKFEMLPIPAGKIRFAIDDKSPPHEVQIKPFWMAKTECTWDEYDVFFLRLDLDKDDRRPFLVDRNGTRTRPSLPYDAPDQGFGHSGYPAISLTAHAGKIYCKWLSEKSGRKYRL